ncbi:MAG TPA: acyl-CoA dehydrogenase family protein [Bryobacteraceae bacterium]|nr:acyl-CoA dehydrogenase family protein [Bryobacteraceae bacterium]
MMNFLLAERQTLNRFAPGLDDKLAAIGLARLEAPESGGIELFRTHGGPGLLIPKQYSGLGATAVEALRFQRALGSRSPSLAVAATMHHFSVATLVTMCAGSTGMEWLLLQAIAEQQLLVASGFAEGQSGGDIRRPGMQARKVPQGVVVNGSKKPCSLSRSMNLLTASVTVSGDAGCRFGIVLIPAESEGIERRPFWSSFVLAGAESDEIVLRDVFVPERLVFYGSDDIQSDASEGAGFLWFELLISASYVGVASALVERVLLAGKGTAQDRCTMAVELEGAMAALESVAHTLMTGQPTRNDFARALFVRYAVQHAIDRAAALATELLGGMAFVQSSDAGYLCAATRALAFHPPSRMAASNGLANYLAGGELKLE